MKLLLVDDVSPDNSKEAIKKHLKDSRFKVVYREENGGLSAARNSGIKGLEVNMWDSWIQMIM